MIFGLLVVQKLLTLRWLKPGRSLFSRHSDAPIAWHQPDNGWAKRNQFQAPQKRRWSCSKPRWVAEKQKRSEQRQRRSWAMGHPC